MPLEYAGYLPTQQIDWGSLSGKVADTITKIGEDRAARKAELDKAAEDVNSLVSNTDLSGSQTLNGAILDGAMTARNQIARWTKELKMGQMKPDEYKKRMSSLSSNWSTLTNSVKTFDEKFSDIMKRQQPDENGKVPASSFELALASEYGKLADLTNRSLQISDDGSLLWTKVDPATGQVVSMDDVRAMNKPENIIDNRLDVPQQVESLTKGFDPWMIWQATGKGGEINIEDIRNNPDFKFMKANVMNTVANNPRAIVSILSDNGVVAPMFYKNDDERKQKREAEVKRLEQINKDAGITGGLTADQLKKIDLSLIKYEMGPDGVINPVPNEEQTNAAKNRVGQEIEIQMGRKVTGTPQAYYKPESGGGTGKTEEKTDNTLYTKASQAFNLPFNKKAGSPERESARIESGRILTNLSGGKYTFAWGTGPDAGFLVITDPAYGTEVGRAKSLDEIAPYLFGTSEAQGSDKGMAEYKRQKSMGITTPQTRTTVTTSKAPR
jgi:hypothetical protein